MYYGISLLFDHHRHAKRRNKNDPDDWGLSGEPVVFTQEVIDILQEFEDEHKPKEPE